MLFAVCMPSEGHAAKRISLVDRAILSSPPSREVRKASRLNLKCLVEDLPGDVFLPRGKAALSFPASSAVSLLFSRLRIDLPTGRAAVF